MRKTIDFIHNNAPYIDTIPHVAVLEVVYGSPLYEHPERFGIRLSGRTYKVNPTLKIYYPFDEINGFLEIDIPFTATVIPFEDYTEETVDILSKNGVELMVHMPMEPESYPRNDPGKHAIYIKLPPDEIKKRIRAAIENIPLAVGMNNHMGSKATAHKRTMEIVAGALVESGLFFVDSRTSLYSCAEQEVAKRGIPTTHQDGNIDVESDTSAIARRFIELALSSRENDNGALIVGHARPNTLIAIKRVLPTLEKWGIEFITVSEMVSRRQKEN